MSQIKKDQQQYGMGYSDRFIHALKQRQVETHAQFLIPYLKPETKLLDCGCGPGSMTIGFARYAKCGEVIGIDIEDSQIEMANEDAEKSGLRHVTFQHASVFDLPFENDTFDIVFSHALLSHLKDPVAALKEQMRVVKPGGIVAARAGYASGISFCPKNPILEEAWHFHMQPVVDNGGDPDIGIRLGELFLRAGLSDIKHILFCDMMFTKNVASFLAEEVLHRDYSQKLLAEGKISLAKLQTYQKAWLNQAKAKHVFSYNPMGEAIGVK